jgi:hypothetical protein
MRRLAAVLVAITLGLTACTGGGGGKDAKDRPSLPLPAKAPSARGPAIGPAMQPKVLLAASDELEQLTGSLDTAQVQRRSGAFISGRTVVGYSVDNISGYDLDSGKLLWTSKLDLGGGTVCYVSQPDRAVKTFTVAYGDSSYCSSLATLRVSTGAVVKKSDKLDGLVQFEGESAGGTVNHLFTVRGRDYLVDMRGVVWKMVKGDPEPIAKLEDRSYFSLYPTPKGDMLIGSRLSDTGRCRVDGYALPSFKHAWTEDTKTLFPEVHEDCVISAAPGNSAWLAQESRDDYFMVQVDPATGSVLGRADAPKDSGGKAAKGEFDLASASNQLDQALGLPGGDTIFSQVRGLTRYSLKTGKVVWDLDLSQFQLDSADDDALTTVLPRGVTADGYLVASISNDTAVEIVAVDVKTGSLVARWAVPPKYRNGFQVEPGMTLFGGGVVLTRNFDAWERAFADYLDVKEPAGDKYDIGVFTFPKPDNSRSSAVPTVGPVDTQAKALAGVKTPSGSDDRSAGAVSTGPRLVAYAGNTLTGFEASSGKQKWTLNIDDDVDARICAAGQPDRAVKTLTIAYRGGAKTDRCDTVVRIDASKGEVMDRVEVPASARSVSRMVVDKGVVHIVTGDRSVSRLVDGALVKQARLAHPPYSFERSPQDPSLLITTSSIKGGRDWAIDAYRLPTFERAWSTTASAAFSRVDRRNPVFAWRGNGLVLSTTFGDTADSEATVKDSLVQLDPESGRVAARTGAITRDYLDDDLKRFSLVDAVSSAYLTVGFKDGDVVIPQDSGVMRYSVADKAVRWTVDTKSIMESMERDRGASSVTQHFDLVDGGKTILVTLSNDTSVELMTLNASNGKITGRWNVPKKSRNGLQASPEVTPFSGGVALSHDDYSWDYAFTQSKRKVPPEQRWDVGLFRLTKPKG